jgi:hypothetical protein
VAALLGAGCDNSGTTTPPATMAGTGAAAGTGVAGTTPQAGTGTVTGGTGTTSTGGTGTTGTSGTGAAGTGTATAGTGTATAGTGTATAGTGGGTAGTGTSATPGFAMCGGAPKTGECKAKAPGIYGMKTEVDVWYMDEINTDSPLFDPGRSKITIYFRGTLSDVCEDGSGGKGMMHPCGTRLPPLYADVNGGVIQIEFPDALWDKPGIPDYESKGSTTGFGVGDTLTISKTTGLVGLELMTPDAAFPTYMQTTSFACKSGMGIACFPDMDGDMNPGITVTIKQDGTPPNPPYTNPLGPWHYIPAPTDLGAGLLGDGATKVYIGLRTRLGGSGKIGADCSSGSGVAEAEDFESRTVDCVMKNGSKCNPDGAEFVDKNVPLFHVLKAGEMPPAKWKHARSEADATLDRSPSKGPQSSVVRLADLGSMVSCEMIRGAQYPAPAP